MRRTGCSNSAVPLPQQPCLPWWGEHSLRLQPGHDDHSARVGSTKSLAAVHTTRATIERAHKAWHCPFVKWRSCHWPKGDGDQATPSHHTLIAQQIRSLHSTDTPADSPLTSIPATCHNMTMPNTSLGLKLFSPRPVPAPCKLPAPPNATTTNASTAFPRISHTEQENPESCTVPVLEDTDTVCAS